MTDIFDIEENAEETPPISAVDEEKTLPPLVEDPEEQVSELAEELDFGRARASDDLNKKLDYINDWEEAAFKQEEEEEEEEEPGTEEDTEEEETSEEPEPGPEKESVEKDIFDTKPKRQKSWLANRTEIPKDFFKPKKRKKKLKKVGRKLGQKDKVKRKNKKNVQQSIQVMTAAGITPNTIAKLLGFHRSTLDQYYMTEINYGRDILTTRIVNALVQRALDGSVQAQMFYLKSRADWKEADKNDPSEDAITISEIERAQRISKLFMTNPKIAGILKSLQGTKPSSAVEAPIDVEPVEPESEG